MKDDFSSLMIKDLKPAADIKASFVSDRWPARLNRSPSTVRG